MFNIGINKIDLAGSKYASILVKLVKFNYQKKMSAVTVNIEETSK